MCDPYLRDILDAEIQQLLYVNIKVMVKDFWCHAEKDWIEDMRDESREIYKNLIKEENK